MTYYFQDTILITVGILLVILIIETIVWEMHRAKIEEQVWKITKEPNENPKFFYPIYFQPVGEHEECHCCGEVDCIFEKKV